MKVQRLCHIQRKSTSRDYNREVKNISTTIMIKNKIQFRQAGTRLHVKKTKEKIGMVKEKQEKREEREEGREINGRRQNEKEI